MIKNLIIILFTFFIFISHVYSEDITDGRVKGLMEVYQEGFNEGQKKGYDKGYYDGYKQAVDDFKQIFREKLSEYKALEAGKFLLKNWYISYPKVYQVTTDKGIELIVEGCSIMRPFDDLSEKIFSTIPSKQSESYQSQSSLTKPKLDITTEKSFTSQVTRKVDKKYIQEVQKLGLKYISPIDHDYIVVFFDDEKSVEKFCIIYGGCM